MTPTNALGVWTTDDCALVLVDYQKEMFDSIRSDVRYIEIVRSLNLPLQQLH